MKKITQLLFLLILASQSQAQYKSLLWKISGNGIKDPAYLYGTMHTGDSRVIALSEKARPYFNNAKAYAMELDPAESMDMGLLSRLMMGKDYSLRKMLPAMEYAFLDSIVTKQIGFSMALFDNVAPVFVMTIFESMSLGLSDSSLNGNTQVLDLYFYDQAKKAKKKIIGIETADEQLDALGTLGYKEQADLLVEEMKASENNAQDGKDVLRYYLNQDLDSLSATDNDAKMPDKFYKALVTDRNKRMADRIAKFIKDQPTFIAIGALHLPGQQGVIELLRKKGFTVEAVNK